MKQVFVNFITWHRQQDPYFFYPIVATTFSLVLMLSLFAYHYPNLPSKLPLFYSLSWGEQQLVTKFQFLLLPTLLTLLNSINLLLAFYLHPLQMVPRRLLTVSLILFDGLIITTFIKILSIFI